MMLQKYPDFYIRISDEVLSVHIFSPFFLLLLFSLEPPSIVSCLRHLYRRTFVGDLN